MVSGTKDQGSLPALNCVHPALHYLHLTILPLISRCWKRAFNPPNIPEHSNAFHRCWRLQLRGRSYYLTRPGLERNKTSRRNDNVVRSHGSNFCSEWLVPLLYICKALGSITGYVDICPKLFHVVLRIYFIHRFGSLFCFCLQVIGGQKPGLFDPQVGIVSYLVTNYTLTMDKVNRNSSVVSLPETF